MKQQTVLVAAAVLGALSLPAFAQPPDAAGVTTRTSPGKGTMTRTRSIVATVAEIDAPQRQVTLRGPDGNLLRLVAGPEVRNFEQVKPGDRVAVRYEDALSLELKKGGKELRSSIEAGGGALAAPGERPGGALAGQIEITADVVGIDAARQTITLRGPDRTVDLWLPDPEQVALVRVGDQVHAVYRQALALSVEPAPEAGK